MNVFIREEKKNVLNKFAARAVWSIPRGNCVSTQLNARRFWENLSRSACLSLPAVNRLVAGTNGARQSYRSACQLDLLLYDGLRVHVNTVWELANVPDSQLSVWQTYLVRATFARIDTVVFFLSLRMTTQNLNHWSEFPRRKRRQSQSTYAVTSFNDALNERSVYDIVEYESRLLRHGLADSQWPAVLLVFFQFENCWWFLENVLIGREPVRVCVQWVIFGVEFPQHCHIITAIILIIREKAVEIT